MTTPTPGRPLRVLFASAEAYPFAKAGGLADVSGALPKALAELGHDVRLVIPGYRGLGGTTVRALQVPLGGVDERVVVRHLGRSGGVDVLALGFSGWFDREGPYGYQDDDVLPFVLFSKAVTALAAEGPWRPDVLHGNDWHCGLVAQEARQGPHRAALARTAVVFTIHNIAYQGPVGVTTDRLIGLPPAGTLIERGIAFADRVNTVSPRYLREILTPAQGAGLDALLRTRGDAARGILNGVDYEEFAPERDRWITARYDGSFVHGKGVNKAALQRVSGLDVDPGRPLLGVVARLVHQKGIGLLCSAVDDLVARGAQVVVMGEGQDRYRLKLQAASRRHPRAVVHHPTADEALARQVYAGSDLFLAPSVFEPCGLTPLIALRYATIPVVRRTGGLADTITDYTEDPEAGLGFAFEQRRVASLLSAVDAALAVRARPAEWQRLQRRAMAADFSWPVRAREYAALYAEAVRARRSAGPSAAPPTRRPPRPAPMPVALVHHANQYLVTDGYADREGISALVAGYAALLRLHEKHRVPVNVHLSGTLVEAAAWHHPWFLDGVRRLRAAGLLSLVGGTYAENVMPAFDPDFNRRQLRELLHLYERHLGCRPQDLRICWVPERVWSTELLAGVLTDPSLANGGYRYVLLDDRLLYSAEGGYPGSDRESFDAADPSTPPPADALHPYEIADGHGLQVVPMSTRLRHWVPPEDRGQWRGLARTAALPTAPGDDAVLVYADDMEKAAGVGQWDRGALARYEAFLRWLSAQQTLVPVSLPAWLEQRRRAPSVRALEPGTFVELAQDWRAGEDYRGWGEDPRWLPSRDALAAARGTLAEVEAQGADPRLGALAWKHLLASAYETAWHDTDHPGRPPAPWAVALAAHARATHVLAAAARWSARSARPLEVELADVDDDGEEEVVLRNEHLFAVLAPACGGRLVYLACRGEDGGALVVGNPTDDWNWQQPLNRYMDVPANHPGALADVGSVHDRYDVRVARHGDAVVVDLVDTTAGSPLLGLRKRVLLEADAAALVVGYELPAVAPALTVEACLSPDYYRLLRDGRSGLLRDEGPRRRGAHTGRVAVWLALAGDEETAWCDPGRPEPGHGVLVALRTSAPSFHLLLGVGDVDDAASARALAAGRQRLAEVAPAVAVAPVGGLA